MSYKALYRKYRPQLFGEVVSQAAIIQTLQNAIISGKISHAYLFSGPRGTGKTTVARIFAKALNCSNPVNGEPCCECTNCKEISEIVSPDVIEIDAASNNGVDEIRDIREKVKFLPSGAKYKIYIIDEVHMLSTGAFNALLKTLEEPPKHVIFILATTEPQKLPATIISRCQRFDFKSIGAFDISIKLKSIAEKEESTISEEAINAISEAAEGGMRDALSILDQVISYGNKNISLDDVITITGSISFDKMIELMNYVEAKNVNFALESVNDFITTGKEASKIVNTMLIFCRDLLLYKNIGDKNSNKYIFEKEKFQELAEKLSINKILYYIDLLCDVQNKLKLSTTPNIYLEITVIKMCSVVDSDLDLIKRMTTIEEKIENGNFSSDGEGGSIDSEKLSIVDAKVNRVVTELNKLELHKLAPRIEEIEQKIESNGENEPTSNSSSIQKEIENIKFDIENLKNDALVSGSSDSVSEDKLDDLQEQINELKEVKQSSVVIPDEINFSIEALKRDIAELRTEQENKVNPDNELVNEKISALEEKLNNINFEAKDGENNVDLSEVNEKIDILKQQVEALKNRPVVATSGEVDNNALADLTDTVEILKMEYADLKNSSKSENQAQNSENTVYVDNSEQINDLLAKVNELASKIDNLETNNQGAVSQQVVVSNVNDNVVLELKEKVQTLESRMYKLVSESISASSKNKAKPEKKPNGQIMLFGDDIIGVEDIEKQSKETVDFGELTKTDDDIENEKADNQEYVQETLPLDDNVENDVEEVVAEQDVQSDEQETNEVEEETTIEDEQVELEDEGNNDSVEQEKAEETLFDVDNNQNENVDENTQSDEQDIDVEEFNEEEKIDEPKTAESLFSFDFGSRDVKKNNDYSYEGDLFNFGAPSPKKEEPVETAKPAEPEQKVEPVVKPVEKVKDVIIEQHYDPSKQESVVTKTNSMLVTRDKQATSYEDMNIEKSLLMHEKEEKVQPTPVQQQTPEIIVGKHEEVADKFMNYDVKDIEQLLFDSQSAECRNDRTRIKEIWPTLVRGIAPDLIPIINTLAKGQIKVVGNKELIISYPDVSYCNQVMRPKFKREALRVLYSKFDDTYNYIALTEDAWNKMSQEYKNQYYTGTKKPKLSPIQIPGLNIIDDGEEYVSRDDETVNKAIEFFGSNIVKDRR